MKKYILCAAMCAAVLAAGCTKQDNSQDLSGFTTLEASLSPLTRTTIDGVKISWAAEDAINVNGTASNAIETGGDKATFSFSSEVSAPFSAIYPSTLYHDSGEVWLKESLSLEQTCMIPLAAYATSGSTLAFSPVTAVLKIPVTSESGLKLSSVTLKGNAGEQLSGPFSIDYTVPALTGGNDASCKTVTVDCGDITLGTTPLLIYIPIPAGSYSSGFEIEFKTSDDNSVVKGTSARTVAAGELRVMPAVELTAAAAENGIYTAADLAAFAEAVNSGASTAQWENGEGEVALMADIDLADYSSWTPIGNPSGTGNGNNACSISGSSFRGVFNGGGHTISNFKAGSGTIANGCTWGLFGALVCATVKNLNIECDDVIFSAESTADAGVLAGTVYCSTISNVKVSGSIVSYGNNTDNKRFAIGGIAGFVFSDAEDGESVITQCQVELNVSGGSGMNTKNGATGVQFGGIAGFTTTVKDVAVRNRISDCTASGEFTLTAGRTSGIVAAANSGTVISNCVNQANQTNGFADGRVGNIVCILNLNCGLIGCVNYGNVTTTNSKTTTGALAALLNDDSCYIEGGANYGTVISAYSGTTRYSGLIGANLSKFHHITEVTVSGKLGVYDGDLFDINAENFMDYIGAHSAANAAKITSLTYVAP